MAKKIDTINFGPKNLLAMKPIPGIDDLFVGEIAYTGNGSRFRIQAIIDKELKEIVPFGQLHRMLGIRVINKNMVIVDHESVAACYDVGWGPEYGSLLLEKDAHGFRISYNSNASIMYVTSNMLFGANYVATEEEAYYSLLEDTSYPVETFEFDYQANTLVNQKTFDRATKEDLQFYFYDKLLPYPEKMLQLRFCGKMDCHNTYKFVR